MKKSNSPCLSDNAYGDVRAGFDGFSGTIINDMRHRLKSVHLATKKTAKAENSPT